ncbi:MAG: hypothetical protein LBB86_06920 [Oscillospiraceae bacterium]|jgi:hypothetical protein|nr:hypothetical protein [Oscillospiraceae bacterium]
MREKPKKSKFVQAEQLNPLNRFKPHSLGDLARHSDAVRSDVLGSYTGTPAYESDSAPTQDADDL